MALTAEDVSRIAHLARLDLSPAEEAAMLPQLNGFFDIVERMGVAVAASCAFLTPIGHQSNVLVMGPGGYRFGDYWPMGLPLEILIAIVAVPMILWVWPL